MVRKVTLRKRYNQRGKSDLFVDRTLRAKKVGWRKSESGKWYFENRKNRSDKRKWI